MSEIVMKHINGTIIIVALYIINDQDKYNCTIKCLSQLRNVYPTEVIVIVDNQSPNREWYELAKSLNYDILYNDSNQYKYEIGAYNLALKHYSADKYICIQSSLYIHKKIENELSSTESDAIAFSSVYGLHWDTAGLNLINEYLKSVNMKPWNDDPLVLWNCFYCNDIYMQDLKKSGLLDLVCNTKNCSCAYERLLGCHMYRLLNQVKSIDNSVFTKYWLSQI